MRIGTLGTRLNLPSGPDLLLAYSAKPSPILFFPVHCIVYRLSPIRFISDYLIESEKFLSKSYHSIVNSEPIERY